MNTKLNTMSALVLGAVFFVLDGTLDDTAAELTAQSMLPAGQLGTLWRTNFETAAKSLEQEIIDSPKLPAAPYEYLSDGLTLHGSLTALHLHGQIHFLDHRPNAPEKIGLYLQHLIAVFGLFAESEGLLPVEFEGFQIRYLRYVEMFGYLRTDLSRVAVDCLPAGNDKVVVHSTQSTCQRTRRSQRVGTAQLAVGEQYGSVYTHSHSLTQDSVGLRQTHSDNRNVCSVLVFELQGKFETSLIVGVHNTWHTFANKSTRLRIYLHLRSIGHLFDTNYYIHKFFGFSDYTFFIKNK